MGKRSEYQLKLKMQKHEKLNELKNQLPDYVHHYLDDMVIDYQINTLVAYARDLITFFEFIQERNPVYKNTKIKDIPLSLLESLTYQDITEYRNYLASNFGTHMHTNQSSSIERRMAPLRGFFADACNNKIISNNPTAIQNTHRKKRKEKKEIVYLENDEVSRLLYYIDNSMVASEKQQKFCLKTHLRDMAIMTLLLNTGIRVSECVGIDMNDLNFTDNSVKIVRKGGNESTIYFNENTKQALQKYIELERPKFVSENGEKALFLSSKHQRMAVRSIQAMVKKYSLEAIPNKNLSPHKMRSSYGTALYEQTGDIRLVADVLGHVDVTTTAKHYAAMKTKHMKQAGKIDPYA